MRLEIRYVTEFIYPGRVRESHNQLRACPTSDDHQRLVAYQLEVDPPARVQSFTDYWGTQVDAFGVRQPHDRLTVVADSVVDTDPREPPDPVPAAAYDDAFRSRHWQFLQRSPHVGWDDALAELGTGRVGEEATSSIRAIEAVVRESLAYVPGTTYVGVDVNEVLANGEGVCQDFSHVALAVYRAAGFPARYVSGYLYAADQSVGTAPVTAEIEVQTHAWVEVAVPGFGWWALDPTNDHDVGERHVKIGHGRDYDDALPLRGVYHGEQDHVLGVRVQISREEMAAFAASDVGPDGRRAAQQQQ